MDRIDRYAAWLYERGLPCAELRYGTEVIDVFTLPEGAEWDESVSYAVAEQFCDSATDDAASEGKKRRYTIVAIASDGQQYVCPVPIVRRPDRGGNDKLVETLARQNVELNKILVRDRKDGNRQILDIVDGLVKALDRERAENERMRARSEEVITTLENLRTKALERDILREKHEKSMEIQERITDTVLPLAMATVKRFTNGKIALPGGDLDSSMLVSIAKAMNEQQLDAIRQVLGDELGPEVDRFITETAVSGVADMAKFRSLVERMTHEQQTMLRTLLNPGQQAALRELLS